MIKTLVDTSSGPASMEETKPNTTSDVSALAETSDSTFRLLVDQVTDYAIFLLTPTGEVRTWNPGAERIKRYKPHEIIGKHFRTFYSPEAQRAKIPEEELKIAAATGRFEDEGWRIRGDGTKFWASVIITAIRDENGILLGYGKVTRDLTERKLAEEQLRELSHSLLKAQDEERGRLGRELHDTFGQYLTALKMSLDGILSDSQFDESDVRARLNDCIPILDRAIREVRTLSYLLYPPMLEELGLSSAIRWHLEEFSKRSGIATSVEISDNGRLSKDMELALFRILQESLTNVHRHSRSRTASVRFIVDERHALLEIQDQGQGLPSSISNHANPEPASLGVGIRGMQARVRQLAGSLEITSNATGTTVRAKIPLDSARTASSVSS
jgi:PAS domain S-box-containing protein